MEATLYQLTGELLELLSMADDPDVDDQILADTLEALEGDFDKKVEDCCKARQEIIARAEIVKAESKRLADKAAALTKSADSIFSYLEKEMTKAGKKEVKSDLFKIKFKKNPAKVVIADGVKVADLDPQFIRWKDPEIDKTAVKEALKAGEELDFAKLVQETVLSIK